MKISKKTLAAAEKAAKDQGISLDSWAEKALADAASRESALVHTLLQEISEKIDQIASRQSLSARANEQLATAIQEVGKSYSQVRRTTGEFIGDVATKTSSAFDDFREKTRDLIAQVGITGSDTDKPAAPSESADAPTAAANEPLPAPKPARRTTATRKSAQTSRASKARSKRVSGRKAPRSGRRK